jgi:glycyl-tRNA synthetase beta chain
LLILFTELGYRQDIIKASFVGNGINPYSVYIRVLKLSKLVKTKDGNDFLKSFKRIDSFTDNSNNEDFNQNIFIEKEEFDLNDLLSEIKKKYLVEEDFMFQDFKLMKRITNVLNGFCDNVTVNVDDQKIKKNRKALISKFYKIMDDLYNFSILEIR